MQINSLSNNIKSISKNHSSNPINFKGQKEDEIRIQYYRQKFNKLNTSDVSFMTIMRSLSDKKIPKKEAQEYVRLINELKQENDAVKKSILTTTGETKKYLLSFAYKNELGTEATNSLLEMIKDFNNEEITAKLILGGTNNKNIKDTAFYQAWNDEDALKKIIEIINNSSIEIQKKFYTMKSMAIPEYLKSFTSELNINNINAEDFLKQEGKLTAAKIYEDAKKEFLENHKELENVLLTQEYDVDNSSGFKIIGNVKTKFEDVGGMFNVKKQIQNELLNLLKNPDIQNEDKPSGILLYGPPGTGKTLLATAIAGEANVPFISTNGSSFANKYVGGSEQNVRSLYKTAKELAKKSPSKTAIIFIDEIDAIGRKRGETNNTVGDSTLNQLLTEMDGVNTKEENDIKIITIGATNRKDILDPALIRSGRIDMEFEIDDPSRSEKARKEILNVHAKDKPFKDKEEKERLLTELARTTAGSSGAELAEIIKKAYRKTLYANRKNPYITQDDITQARLETLAGVKKDSEEFLISFERTIAHETGHAINSIVLDDVFEKSPDYLKPLQTLDYIVNEPRGNFLGATCFKPSDKNSCLTFEAFTADIITGYGGMTTEEELYDGHTDGCRGDLKQITEEIKNAVLKYGFGKTDEKYISIDENGKIYELYKPQVKQTVDKYSQKAYEISKKINNFAKAFIMQYSKKYANLSNNEDKIVQGDEFRKQFKDWIKENHLEDKYNMLLREIQEAINTLKNEA